MYANPPSERICPSLAVVQPSENIPSRLPYTKQDRTNKVAESAIRTEKVLLGCLRGNTVTEAFRGPWSSGRLQHAARRYGEARGRLPCPTTAIHGGCDARSGGKSEEMRSGKDCAMKTASFRDARKLSERAWQRGDSPGFRGCSRAVGSNAEERRAGKDGAMKPASFRDARKLGERAWQRGDSP